MKKYNVHKSITISDGEGGKYPGYEEKASSSIKAEIWPASGKVQAEMYGLRLAYIMNMITDLRNEVNEIDGICVYSDVPDYKIISKKKYTNHIVYELEKIIP